MLFTPKSGSQLQPRPSAYKPRHCAYKTPPLCLTVWRAEGLSYGTSIDASRFKETCAILLSKRLSHVGCSGRVIYSGFAMYLHTFCIPRVPLQ